MRLQKKRCQKVVLLCLLLLFLATAANAKIVFSSTRLGTKGVYLMDDDGSNLTLLIEDDFRKPYPDSWSPDGKQILFKQYQSKNVHKEGLLHTVDGYVFFLMDADGTNRRQLTENDGSLLNRGTFSPDGTSIIFYKSIRIDEKRQSGIYELNIETGKLKEIADIDGINGDWSPDGKHYVYAMPWGIGGGSNSTIWIMGADGHNPRPLVPDPGVGEFAIYRSRPRWSPDSKHVLFQQREYKFVFVPNRGNVITYRAFRYIICDRKGENIKQLRIPKDWEGYGIDWMDDGKSIVFGARVSIPLNKPLPRDFVYPTSNIYKYHIHTGEITRLTNHPGTDGTLDWISDDGLSVSAVGKKEAIWGALKQ